MAPVKSGEVQQPSSGLTTVSKTQLTKHEPVPDYLQGTNQMTGLEDMDRSDMVLPRLAIAQSLSPALKKNNSKHIPGLEEGMFYNTVTREIYGTKIRVVPIIFSKMRIYFEDINKGGGIICNSLNGVNGGRLHPSDCATCEHAKFSETGDPPDCNNFMNYASFLPDYESSVIVVSMKSTALAVAKQWNSLMRLLRKPAFAKYYQIESVPENKNGNDFFNYKVTQLGWVSEDIYHMGELLHEQLKASGIKVDLSDEELDGDPSFEHGENEQGM